MQNHPQKPQQSIFCQKFHTDISQIFFSFLFLLLLPYIGAGLDGFQHMAFPDKPAQNNMLRNDFRTWKAKVAVVGENEGT